MLRKTIIIALFSAMLAVFAGAQEKAPADSVKIGKPVSTDKKSQEQKTPKKKPDKKIAFTFDNFPGDPIYSLKDLQEINASILAKLAEYKAPAAAFVVGEYLEGEAWEIVIKWLDAGHIIGFHTYSGQSLYDAPLAIFIEDVKRGRQSVEDLVATYKQKERYFRFPFLQYPTDENTRVVLDDEFGQAGIKVAHASVVTEDFVYNMSFEKMYHGADSADLAQFRQEYIDHILERMGHFETVAQEIVGRQVRQIMQLRVNRLNAVFLGDILAELQDKGYEFVSLPHALSDYVYQEEDFYYGSTGISYLERLKYSE